MLARTSVALLAALAIVPWTAGARSVEVRVLVLPVTWGPTPYSEATIQRVVFDEAAAFLRHASFGQAAVVGETTPWLRAFASPPPGCDDARSAAAVASAARRAATAAGYRPESYSRLVYLLPRREGCNRIGIASGNDVWLFQSLFAHEVAHELAHTFNLGHAYARSCSPVTGCADLEYGDRYSVMGSGRGHPNAFEKFRAGWLTRVSRATMEGEYMIDQLEQPSPLPQALVIETARNEYWLDHREPLLEDAIFANLPVTKGVQVHAGPSPSNPEAPSDYSVRNVLLLDPARRGYVDDPLSPEFRGEDALLPGDSFEEQGAFRVEVLNHRSTQVNVRFTWTDISPPTPPRTVKLKLSRPGAVLAWNASADRGSGVLRYEVFLDGRLKRSVRAHYTTPRELTLPRLRVGRHSVRVAAVDRAGNRGRAAERLLVIPKR